jgi:hypothetical protein
MSAITSLRKFAARRPAENLCALCGAGFEARHPHLFEASTARVLCVCRGCAGVFDHSSGKFRRIPERVVRLPELDLGDALWSAFGVPIGLAFFVKNSAHAKIQAFYPSPLGSVESSVPADSWEGLVCGHPGLESMEPDVEALLVRRAGGTREAFIAPLDECHALIGLIRREWRGISGGDEVGPAVDRFFAELRTKSGGLS